MTSLQICTRYCTSLTTVCLVRLCRRPTLHSSTDAPRSSARVASVGGGAPRNANVGRHNRQRSFGCSSNGIPQRPRKILRSTASPLKKHPPLSAIHFRPRVRTRITPSASERFVTFGVSSNGRLVIVAHTEHGGTIRIISARLVKPGERRIYEEGWS